ncbi:MAG: DUF512 domain-containing protein [Clostridiales bacterium]|nr:DUF512 domain-containing protein [Clostridiales bacterium]
MSDQGHVIRSVDPGSIAEELELEPGDRLLTINGNEIEDIFDYEYYVNSPQMLMVVEKKDGELWELEIENEYEDPGINFEKGLMSDYKSCSNHCIFCFIDQMPPGMRETLYFKDDDSRLSFLQGNYVTLTNMSDHDLKRIIDFHLAPINISVHTTNPELRCRMLHNRFAGDSLKKIDLLYRSGIPMNGQIVLCRGINDGEELDRTIRDLSAYLPYMESVSVVPVGLTRYREGLYPLDPFDAPSAAAAIRIIERWQDVIYREHGTHFIHASDEFYLLAGRELPEEERYDGYPQIENGVGMLRLLDTEVSEALEALKPEKSPCEGTISIATGQLAYASLSRQIDKIHEVFPQIDVHIYPIRNDFFGEMITVSGLVTGRDLISQLKGQKLGERLLLPMNMFRSGEEVLLDDVTREDLQNALQVPVTIVKSSGQNLVDAVLFRTPEEPVTYEGYELKEI